MDLEEWGCSENEGPAQGRGVKLPSTGRKFPRYPCSRSLPNFKGLVKKFFRNRRLIFHLTGEEEPLV
jgi:hypothetical protein